MALGTFVPPASGTASSFDPRVNHGKPLIVVVREFRENFTTRKFPNPKDVVIVDVVDLMADTVHVSVIWGGGAMVDRLKGSVAAEGQEPEKLPVVITKVAPAGGGNDYYSIEPLDGAALNLAVAWDGKHPTRIDDERAAKVAADGQRSGGNGQAQQNGGAPITGLGSANATQPATPAAPEQPAAQPAAGGGMDDAALQAAIDSLK